MVDQQTTLLFEIPPDVAQQEVWDVEERLGQVEGVTTELQEPKDLVTVTLLFLHVVAPHLGQVVAIAEGIKATHNIARTLYEFLHPKQKERERGKNKVVIIKKGKRIELYNLSPEEIEKVLDEQ